MVWEQKPCCSPVSPTQRVSPQRQCSLAGFPVLSLLYASCSSILRLSFSAQGQRDLVPIPQYSPPPLLLALSGLGGGVPSVTVFQLLLLFYLLPCRRCSVSLQLFCRMNCSINRHKWVCSMEVSSGYSYVAILDWNLPYFLALTFRKVTNVFKKKPLYFLPIFLLCLCQVIHPFVGQS